MSRPDCHLGSQRIVCKQRSVVRAMVITRRFCCSDAQRVKLALLLESELKKKSEQRMKSGVKRNPLTKSSEGQTRAEIAKAANVSEDTVRKTKKVLDAAKAWIAKNQLGRRNLTVFQKAELGLVCEPEVRKEAKERQKAGGRDKVLPNSGEPVSTDRKLARVLKPEFEKQSKERQKRKPKNSVVQNLAPQKTRDELAKAAGVSAEQYRKGEYVLDNADADTPMQRAELALVCEPDLKKKAKKRQKRKQNSVLPQKGEQKKPPRVEDELAKIAKVGHGTIHNSTVVNCNFSLEIPNGVRQNDRRESRKANQTMNVKPTIKTRTRIPGCSVTARSEGGLIPPHNSLEYGFSFTLRRKGE